MTATLAVLVMVIGACSSSTSPSPSATKKVGTAPPTLASTTLATTLQTDYAVGDKIQTTVGNTLQIYSYDAPIASANQFVAPQPGNQFAAIDVEGCAGPNAPPNTGLNPSSFQLAMADNTRRQPDFSPIREPKLQFAQLPAGQCVRGWVSFQVPVGEKPRFVIFQQVGPNVPTIRWAIP